MHVIAKLHLKSCYYLNESDIVQQLQDVLLPILVWVFWFVAHSCSEIEINFAKLVVLFPKLQFKFLFVEFYFVMLIIIII